MKEKAVITSIMAATYADVASTMAILSAPNGREIGPLGHTLYAEGHMDRAYMAKISLSLVLVGIYALTAKKGTSFSWSYDKVMKVMSVAMWAWPILNTLDLISGGR